VEPVKCLDDPHRRPARPIQPARSGRFEVDHESIEVNRAQPGVCVNCDFCRYCVSKAQLVGRRDSIRKKSNFLPPRDSVDVRGVVWTARFACQRVGAGDIGQCSAAEPQRLYCDLRSGSGRLFTLLAFFSRTAWGILCRRRRKLGGRGFKTASARAAIIGIKSCRLQTKHCLQIANKRSRNNR
jgi:hypothetical protein